MKLKLLFLFFFLITSLFADLNIVEKQFLEKSNRKQAYKNEYFPIIEAEDLCELGKLTALSFLEFINKNPTSSIALPTGKTPEYFIKYLNYYKKNWQDKVVQNELRSFGIRNKTFPDTSRIKFVQIDEFFPIDPKQENSFSSFIKKYYIDLLDLKKENVLLMEDIFVPTLQKHGIDKIFKNRKVNLSVLKKTNKNKLEKLQAQALNELKNFCISYEEKISNLGGIDFFLGGIGPDGHIGFNLRGSDHNSKTRIVKFNYETAAASSKDLGGMKYSKDAIAVTIGLGTITRNKNLYAIIFAPGEAKASIIAKTIQSKRRKMYPATALQKVKNPRFYITKSAASKLESRKHLDFINKKIDDIPFSFIEKTIIEISLQQNKPIDKLTLKDFNKTPSARFLKDNFEDQITFLKNRVKNSLIKNLEKGFSIKDKKILHTSPHHDDILLSYYPIAKNMISNNKNTFCILTSGFTAITSEFTKKVLAKAKKIDPKELFENSYDTFLKEYKNSFFNSRKLTNLQTKIIAKKICENFNITTKDEFKKSINEFINHLNSGYPGKKDPKNIQILKGLLRETEEDRVWAISNATSSSVINMRSGFYKGNFFDPNPKNDIDVIPIFNLLKDNNYDVITVAFDPEGTGPDTHFKVQQVLSEALKINNNQNPLIIGYRNIWHKFSFEEANIFYPITKKDMQEAHRIFINCYQSQKTAAFPSHLHNGPFSELMIKIQKNQLKELKILLGEEFFDSHSNKDIKNAKGLILLKQMHKEEFIDFASDLKKKIQLEL